MPSPKLSHRRCAALLLASAGALTAPPTALAAHEGDRPAEFPTPRLDVASAVHETVQITGRRAFAQRAEALARRIALVRGAPAPRRIAESRDDWSLQHLRADVRDMHAQLRKAKRARKARAARGRVALTGGVPANLQAIAACESGGNPSAVGGGGAFRGKYQFTYATWQAVGGSGDPAAAPEGEQDARAARLYASAGAGQWPVCGR
jgi:hypothetical protein